MKKLAILLIFILMVSCNQINGVSDKIDSMKCPVTIFAEVEPTDDHYGGIILMDGYGLTKEFKGTYVYISALISTFDVGDTIKFCKPQINH